MVKPVYPPTTLLWGGITIMDAEISTHTFLTMIIEEYVCFMSCEPIVFFAIILMWYTWNINIFSFINWTLRMSDNLPERVQILCHAHIICITVLENRIICCQIFGDLLLKSAFERIFNVMQLNLVKIKWHIKWKYLIQKFHDICLSYYFKYCLCIKEISNVALLFPKITNFVKLIKIAFKHAINLCL